MARMELSWNEAPDGSQGLGGQGGSTWGRPGYQGNHWAYREGHQQELRGEAHDWEGNRALPLP